VLFDVVAGRLALLCREVEDAHVTAAARVHRGDPATESSRAVDDHRTLVYISRKRVGHDIAPPCRVAGFDVFEYRLAYERRMMPPILARSEFRRASLSTLLLE
jgi:hypothetical protein